jgi:FAD/FMN-containing dehydrogenase
MLEPDHNGQPSSTTGMVLEIAGIESLKASLRGELLQPDVEGYEAARKVYNGMIDRHPSLIVRCTDVADVISAIQFAHEHQLTLSIRGGSHNVTGFAVNDGGLVVDLSRMKDIRIDPTTRTVRAEGGCTWGELDLATHPFGLAVPGGIVSTTGIAGLTLGGGVGNLTRPYGLTCDNLLSANVVTAEGRLLTASADQNADLFWGLRGGGGNFGVVTSFEYRLCPAGTVLAGPVFYAIEKSRDAMRFYRDFIAAAPDELNSYFGFHMLPPAPFVPDHLHGVNVCMILSCYVGPLELGEELVKPLRQFGPPVLDLLSPMPLPTLNSLFDALLPAGLQHYWKAHFVKELSDEAIEAHALHGAQVPTYQSGMHLYAINGAAHRIGKDETAFSYRDAHWVANIAAISPHPADMPQHITWVREYWEALRPYCEAGTYINFLGDEGEERIKATYRDNYDRLVALKNKFDPTNLFRMNQNIKPTA